MANRRPLVNVAGRKSEIPSGDNLTFGSTANPAVLDASALTAARTATMPDKNGTVAMTSDIPASYDWAADIHAATDKAVPDDADELGLVDSAASWAKKKLTWANLKAGLQAVFDTLYLPFAYLDTDGTLAANSDTKVASQKAVKTYADARLVDAKAYTDAQVVGLWDDRGAFDASVNAYPASGGSGTAGAILKGDIWTISVAGTLPTGKVVEINDTVRALIDTPGNTQVNWAIAKDNVQTSVSGNAGTATALQTARNIDGVAFNGTADITVVAPAIHAAPSKATPVDADEFGGADSAASWGLAKFTWANIKATLKAYLDTLYAPLGGGMTLKKKTAVTTRASTTTFAADPDLQFAMAANTTYAIRITAIFSGVTAGGAKAELDGPASPTRVQFTTHYNRNSSVSTPAFAAHGAYNTGIFLNLTGSPDYAVLHVEGIVQNGANAGTFSLRWAQQSSNGTGSSCLAGSILEYVAM